MKVQSRCDIVFRGILVISNVYFISLIFMLFDEIRRLLVEKENSDKLTEVQLYMSTSCLPGCRVI